MVLHNTNTHCLLISPYTDKKNFFSLMNFRCQAGDLSGKHGQLQISSDVSNRATYTFVDPNLQLSGASSSKWSD